MLRIDKLEICVYAHPYNNQEDIRHFGRVIPFYSGLNLVVGDNTSGKTTIARCLYYAIGMEELIDGKSGKGALDKSVTTTFRYAETIENEHEWQVTESYVYIQLSNDKGDVITIRRDIVDSLYRDNVLFVWHESLNGNLKKENCREYYIHRNEDHSMEFNYGFYALLAEFGGLSIVNVPSRGDKDTKLYMQTLFALCFIEQTRGWSDFFATIKSYNILNPKQRIIEYAMDYEFDGEYATAQKFKDKRKKVELAWMENAHKFISYLTYNNLYITGLNDQISKQKISISDLKFAVRNQGISISEYIDQAERRVAELERKKIQSKTIEGRNDYNSRQQKYQNNAHKYKDFCINLAQEREKLSAIKNQLSEIEKEIKRYSSLGQVNNIITNIDVKECPICHQTLPVTDTVQSRFSITSEEIEESKQQLKMQKSFLSPILENLDISIKNKELYLLYLEKNLAIEREMIITSASLENINLLPLTDIEQFELVDLKSKIASISTIDQHINNFKEDLDIIHERYIYFCSEIDKLKSGKDKETPFHIQLNRFRTMLNQFGYSSNFTSQIGFKEDESSSYRYLPIVQIGEFEEYIRSDSSASDFIRSLWAYYIVLMAIGKNHPGFIIMDEPCQHSMKESSLKSLFKVCSELVGKQTILFCSSQPRTEEFKQKKAVANNANIENDQDVIKKIVDSLGEEKDKINFISIDPHAIMPVINKQE